MIMHQWEKKREIYFLNMGKCMWSHFSPTFLCQLQLVDGKILMDEKIISWLSLFQTTTNFNKNLFYPYPSFCIVKALYCTSKKQNIMLSLTYVIFLQIFMVEVQSVVYNGDDYPETSNILSPNFVDIQTKFWVSFLD